MKYTVSQIVNLAFKRASLLELTQTAQGSTLSFGIDMLRMRLHELPAYGVTARTRSFEIVPLEAGQNTYEMSAAVIDVLEAMFIPEGQSTAGGSGELRIQLVDQSTWQGISSKDATGTPSLFFPHRVADLVQLFVWPIPNTSGNLRCTVQRRLDDTLGGADEIDLDDYWDTWVIYSLAGELAGAAGLDEKELTLAAQAGVALQRAIGQAKDHPPQRFRVYRSRW